MRMQLLSIWRRRKSRLDYCPIFPVKTINKRIRKVLALSVFTCESVCKPSSVFDGHLSRSYISARFKRVGGLRATFTPPFLHRVGFTPRLVTNLRVSSYLAFPSLPFQAVVFCCTFLEVTFTGSYPAPLPYDARTFLNISCDRLADSLDNYITSFLILQPKVIIFI